MNKSLEQSLFDLNSTKFQVQHSQEETKPKEELESPQINIEPQSFFSCWNFKQVLRDSIAYSHWNIFHRSSWNALKAPFYVDPDEEQKTETTALFSDSQMPFFDDRGRYYAERIAALWNLRLHLVRWTMVGYNNFFFLIVLFS
jgi:hypothetical protein